MVKNPPANVGDIRDTGRSLGQEDPLEEGVASHSSILTWGIPWTEGLAGYSLSDMTERLSTAQHSFIFILRMEKLNHRHLPKATQAVKDNAGI